MWENVVKTFSTYLLTTVLCSGGARALSYRTSPRLRASAGSSSSSSSSSTQEEDSGRVGSDPSGELQNCAISKCTSQFRRIR